MGVRKKKKTRGAKKTGASLNRGGSKQNYRTPKNFLRAVQRVFGKITFDLAADRHNAVVLRHFNKGQNALAQDWTKLRGINWLNPPFGNIPKWAKKCAEAGKRGVRILFLVPASVGAEWFFYHCHRKGLVRPLRQRIVFVGEKNGFPKDLMLVAYGFKHKSGRRITGFRPWLWKVAA